MVALGSLEVLLSDPVDASHLLVRSQFRSFGLTSGRCPHDIADSYLLKMSHELWSGLTSVVCLQTFVLAKCFDVSTDGGGVLPTPECWNPNPYGMVCVSLNCFAADALDGLISLAFCNALNCQWLQLLPWTWVMSVFLPTSAPSASLVGSGLSVWLEWWWLFATRACHWVRSRDRSVHKVGACTLFLFFLVLICLQLLLAWY